MQVLVREIHTADKIPSTKESIIQDTAEKLKIAPKGQGGGSR